MKVEQTDISLGDLENKICKTLNLDNPLQHKMYAFQSLKSKSLGIMSFAKESETGPGTKLGDITESVRDFYKEEGFKVILQKNPENLEYKPPKGLAIPQNYFKSAFMVVERGEERYSINISQGDEYSVYITESHLPMLE